MASLQDFERDYHAPDRDFVLENIRKYGTDDRSLWRDAPAPAAGPSPAPETPTYSTPGAPLPPSPPPQVPAPAPAPAPQQTLLQRYQQDYHAPDRDFVLQNIGQYGTDDRSRWVAPQTQTQAPRQLPVPEGFDATKWNDPTYSSDKYKAGRILAAGGSIQDAANAIGWKVLSGDKIQAPDGRIIDVYRDFGGVNALQWTDIAPPGTRPGGGPNLGAPPTATTATGQLPIDDGGVVYQAPGGTTTTRTTSTGGPGSTGDDELNKEFRKRLLEMMQGGNKPIDLRDPGIDVPYGAAKLASDRELEQGRKELAEMLYAQGGGNMDEGRMAIAMQQGRERAAAGLAGIQGSLVLNEMQARRQQLIQSLDLANAIGARREASELTKTLADLDNQFRYAQLNQAGSQFDRSLGQRQSEFDRSFKEGQRTFNERMDYDWSGLEAALNRQAFLDLLG